VLCVRRQVASTARAEASSSGSQRVRPLAGVSGRSCILSAGPRSRKRLTSSAETLSAPRCVKLTALRVYGASATNSLLLQMLRVGPRCRWNHLYIQVCWEWR
jgi:hypothetical protein